MREIKLWIIGLYYRFFTRTRTFSKCGHKGKKKTWIEVEKGVGGLYEPEEMDYCAECWLAEAIKCAWCGEIILPGQPITLYTPSRDFQVPDYAMYVCAGGYRAKVVGCGRVGCADSGADYAGTWEIPGMVMIGKTAYEKITGENVLIRR